MSILKDWQRPLNNEQRQLAALEQIEELLENILAELRKPISVQATTETTAITTTKRRGRK